MNRKLFTRAAALLTALAATAHPGKADQAHLPEPGQHRFTTTLVDDEHRGGEADGTLELTIGRDGTFVGQYRQVDTGDEELVNGGVRGDAIHLTIPGFQPITGTIENGRIVGYTRVGERTYVFTASPAATPGT
jgi:hypothetical protein